MIQIPEEDKCTLQKVATDAEAFLLDTYVTGTARLPEKPKTIAYSVHGDATVSVGSRTVNIYLVNDRKGLEAVLPWKFWAVRIAADFGFVLSLWYLLG